MPASRTFALAAVILAAGHSSRMGRPKLLLPWGKTTVLGHLLQTWSGLPAQQIAVVCQPADSAIHAELGRQQFPASNRIANPDPDRGMFHSIQCAARWSGWQPALTHWAVALGDQPHLRPELLRQLAAFARSNPDKICQPARGGQARHPVLLPAAAFQQLAGSRDTTLKQFLQSAATGVALLEADDPGLDLDLDHPADYDKARALFPGP